jgi:hypothetical protein
LRDLGFEADSNRNAKTTAIYSWLKAKNERHATIDNRLHVGALALLIFCRRNRVASVAGQSKRHNSQDDVADGALKTATQMSNEISKGIDAPSSFKAQSSKMGMRNPRRRAAATTCKTYLRCRQQQTPNQTTLRFSVRATSTFANQA